MDRGEALGLRAVEGRWASGDARETCFGMATNPGLPGLVLDVGSLEIGQTGGDVAEYASRRAPHRGVHQCHRFCIMKLMQRA